MSDVLVPYDIDVRTYRALMARVMHVWWTFRLVRVRDVSLPKGPASKDKEP